MSEPEDSLEKNYLGYASHGVDDKRRLQIPAAWRPSDSKIDLTMVIWKGNKAGTCIRVFPPKETQALRSQLATMPNGDPKKRSLQWFLGQNSQTVTVDKSGRVCLPKRMAEEAGIGKEAVFVGLFDKFEIWNPERHAVQDATYTAVAGEYFDEIG